MTPPTPTIDVERLTRGLFDWFFMCCMNAELVSNYNRLHGANVSFTGDPRSAIDRAIDSACGAPADSIFETVDNMQFLEFCVDMFNRIGNRALAEGLKP